MNFLFAVLFAVSMSYSCDNSEEVSDDTSTPEMTNPDEVSNTDKKAAITAVKASGDENAYTFDVTIKSPDTGCQQYADWWEILSTDGTLIYRRILAHSHVNEQPFTRSGGTVNIKSTDEVFIRAHMNTNGYGTIIFNGSVAMGFEEATLSTAFAETLAKEQPLPNGCTF